jgi:hypothetical protein
MQQKTYYTVIAGKKAHIVKYAAYPAYEVKLFSGAYVSPTEASQEFKKTIQGQIESLSEKAFERKVSELATHYRKERAKLADWNSGRKVRI